jgi:acetolactate synthase-1/2/3 large subunit
MSKIKVSDLVAEFLEKREIKVVFGIIGSANSHIFDSITKRGYTQIVCVHHEQAAVMAAGAYFRTSGKLSAALVTAGAGSSNAITGVLSNWADSIPCLIISGQEQTFHLADHKDMRMYGIQGFNSTKAVADITKFAKTITDENLVQRELEYASFAALHGRPGPVWLDFPFDLQAKMVEPRDWKFEDPSYKPAFDAAPAIIRNDLNYVLECLDNSRRPVIWGGHGVRLAGAKEEFRQLVHTLQVPTLLTWSAMDLLGENDPFYYGRAGVSGQRRSNFIIQNADFILVLGSRLSLLQAGYDIKNFAPKAKIILVDIDPKEWHKYHEKYDRFIQMDCKYFINELQKQATFFRRENWSNYCREMWQKYPLLEECHNDEGTNYINSYWFVNELNQYMKNDQIIVTDMGTGLLSGHYSIKLTQNQTMFTSLGLGEMGYGLPGAIGAAFTEPRRQVLCLNCDGGMMMNLQELQTIIHHQLPIKIVIFNNDGYLMIKHTQKLLFKGSYNSVNSATGVSLPNFAKLAYAFGFEAYRIDAYAKNRGFIPEILTRFFGNMKPAICEVFMDPEQNFYPKVKGVPQDDGNIVPASLEEMSPLLPYDEIVKAMPWALSERSKAIKR